MITNYPIQDSITEMAALSKEIGFIRKEPDLTSLYDLDPLNKVIKESQQAKTK